MIKKLPWLRSLKKTDPEAPTQLPILCDAASNGEGWWPDSERKQLIRKLVLEKADQVSRREGIDRREFLASACGTATALYMINLVNGCSSGKDPAPMNMLGGNGGSGNGGNGGGGNGGGGSGGSGSGGSGSGGMGGSGSGGTGVSGNGGMSGGGSGSGGDGGFNIPECAMEDIEIAECALGTGGNELVIDMQSHFANTETNPTGAGFLNSFIGPIDEPGRFPWIVRTEGCRVGNDVTACLDRIEFINQILMGSDTTIAVLSGISYALGAQGGDEDALFAVLTNTDLIDGVHKLEMDFPRRMLSHAMVMPNDRLDVQLDMMSRLSNQYTNWKTYPPWTGSGTTGEGYWLDGDAGAAMLQKGIDLNSPIFCIHKGFPLTSFSPVYTDPKDVGPAAKMFPGAYFVIYHSAFEHGLQSGDSTAPFMSTETAWGMGVGQWPEGPYNEELEADEAMATSTEKGGYPLNRGVNSLIWSLRKAGIGPNGTCFGDNTTRTNVYAECGGVWPNLMTGRVEEAMHYWGKLLKYIGEDRIVWGTDCLWFGSPQPLIEAFRAFEISQEFQDTYGYPALTQARKEKILGQNAARLQNVRLGGTDAEIMGCHSDYVSAANLKMKRDLDQEWGRRRDMMFTHRGPRTRREFLKLRATEHAEKLKWSGRFPNRMKV